MAKSHVSGPWAETGVVNSQEAARSSARDFRFFIPPWTLLVTGETGGGSSVITGATPVAGYPVRRHTNNADAALTYTFLFNQTMLIPNAGSGNSAVDSGRNEQTRGVRVTGVEFAYTNLSTGGAALTGAPALTVSTVTGASFQNNVALAALTAVATAAGTAAVTTASDTVLWRPTWTLSADLYNTAYMIGSVAINAAATCDIDIYGVLVTGSVLL